MAITQVLIWPHLKHFMGGDVGLPLVGLMHLRLDLGAPMKGVMRFGKKNMQIERLET